MLNRPLYLTALGQLIVINLRFRDRTNLEHTIRDLS